eukprot:gene15465-17049_t
MGSKLGPSYACLFVGHQEQLIYESYHGPLPCLIKRYIDDIIGATSLPLTDLQKFIDYTNNFHPALQFTHTITEVSLPFLDILLTISGNQISTSIYYKPTDAHCFLHYNSSHPRKCKDSIPYSQLRRLCRICSSDDDFKIKADEMTAFFTNNLYPKAISDNALSKVSNLSQEDALVPSDRTTSNNRGKPPYVRASNQTYQQMQPTQPTIQPFQRSQQRYPQQAGQTQPVQFIQPVRMQYPGHIMSQHIIQSVPPQNQTGSKLDPVCWGRVIFKVVIKVRFIPTQGGNQFVPSVQTSNFEPTSQYPFAFSQPTAYYSAPVSQIHNYQTQNTQQIGHTVATNPHMQIQANQQPHSTSQPVSTLSQTSSTWHDKKRKSVITIRDPKQGGKIVTDEVLKIKKDVSAEPAVVNPEKGADQIKEKFKTQVLLAKSTKEDEKNGFETSKDESSSLNQVKHESEFHDISTNQTTEPNPEQKLQIMENADVDHSMALVENSNINPDETLNSEEFSDATIVCNNQPDAVILSKSDSEEVSAIESNEDSFKDDSIGGISAGYVLENQQDTLILGNENENLVKVNDSLPSNEVSLTEKSTVSESNELVEVTASTLEEKIKHVEEVNDFEMENADEPAHDQEVPDSTGMNGDESGSARVVSAQAANKKKKPKQRIRELDNKGTRDTDMMSAFTDKPVTDEVVECLDTPEESREEDVPLIEETWEDKEIKVESLEKSDKRIIYDRAFLLEFQDRKEKPQDLPDIDLVLSEPHPPTKPIDKNSRVHHSGHLDLLPNYMRQNSGNRQAGSGRGGKGPRTVPTKKIIPSSFEKVSLKKSENAWVRPSELTRELTGEEQALQELYRKARGILNKLTPQNFSSLVEQMKALDFNSHEKLKGVIDIIFEKALSEPGFSAAYAKLCDEIAKQKVPHESGKGSHYTFKRILLNKCQAEFEKEKTDELQLEKEQLKHFENADEEKNWQEELADRKHKAKRRSLGNIRFIGELFKLKMLTEAIMHTCVVKLLRDGDEESLECLCQLLTTIGKDLDHEKAKQRNDQYFDQISKVIQQRKVCSRVIFMLQNIKELRATNWVARRASDAPKTIAEIHKEAKQEELEMQMAHQQAAQKRGLNKGCGRDSPGSMRGSQTSEEGWNQVPLSNKNSRSLQQQVDPAKLKLSKRTTDSENISLGPGGRHGSWAQGSSGGGSRFGMAPSSDTESRHGNRYSALSAGDSTGRPDGKGRTASRSSQQSGRFGSQSRATGNKRSQQSFTDERAAALASVRKIVVDKPKTASPPNISSKPSEEYKQDLSSPEPPSVTPCNEQPTLVEPSDEKIKHETKLTIEEFLLNRDIKEAENCVKELRCGTKTHLLVFEAINIAIEKKPDIVKSIGELLRSFVTLQLISVSDFKEGLGDILEFAEDIAVDIPMIWTNLGIVLAYVMMDNFMPLLDLSTLFEPLIRCNKVALLMAKVLSAMSELSSEDAVASLWQESGLQWEKLLETGEDVDGFICKHELGFTIKNNDETMEIDLLEMLKNSCSCQNAIDWVEKRSQLHERPCFVTELCLTVFNAGTHIADSNVKFDADFVMQYKDMLMKYIGKDEVQALFAAQSLADSLKHPQGVLESIFHMLYDNDMVASKSFLVWENCKEPPQGKGMALESVKGFLSWLHDPTTEKPEEI